MPSPDPAADALLLALRFGLLFALYGFLLGIFLIVRRELGQQTHPGGERPGRLVVVDGGETGLPAGHVLPLRSVNSLGRAPESTLVLNDTFVSATHAWLTWRDGRWWLRDAASTNGTALNRQPLTATEVAVEFGDLVTLGRLHFKLTR